MKEVLFKYLERLVELNDSDKESLASAFVEFNYEKGDYILSEGDVAQSLYFVIEGYCRIYVSNDTVEKTVHLSQPMEFLGAFSSFVSQSPSFEFIQALTPVKGLKIDYASLQDLYITSHLFSDLGRKIMEYMFLLKETRVINLIKHSPKENYLSLLETAPGLTDNVPLVHIASFLGITPETLSRIRSGKI